MLQKHFNTGSIPGSLQIFIFFSVQFKSFHVCKKHIYIHKYIRNLILPEFPTPRIQWRHLTSPRLPTVASITCLLEVEQAVETTQHLWSPNDQTSPLEGNVSVWSTLSFQIKHHPNLLQHVPLQPFKNKRIPNSNSHVHQKDKLFPQLVLGQRLVRF